MRNNINCTPVLEILYCLFFTCRDYWCGA